ncbi:MAG: hypothetical protein F6K58_04485 [Symploca sp. SIO2E9]|nr:hypothetical protein [Symploca sp. SIO2E9]
MSNGTPFIPIISPQVPLQVSETQIYFKQILGKVSFELFNLSIPGKTQPVGEQTEPQQLRFIIATLQNTPATRNFLKVLLLPVV